MTLVKFRPTDSLVHDLMLDNFRNTVRRNHWLPAVDIEENEDSIVIYAELPGMSKDDFKITVKEDMLIISGEKKTNKLEDSKNYRHYERFAGNFERKFRLNTEINRSNISAGYQDGILTLTLPKAEEAKPKEIEVKIG
jgi:HSP20 family protein